jgi:hypothetical protein
VIASCSTMRIERREEGGVGSRVIAGGCHTSLSIPSSQRAGPYP